jgi:hypothetical protein
VESHKADVRQVAGCVASSDDTARFLRELRQLRDGAGLGHAELAARAHYPYDCIKAAEVGPALPDLPVLSAYVRGCGGSAQEWEERWRSLTSTPSLPVSEARQAGGSAAAAAGARIGSVAQGADNPDPAIIIAALSRVAEGMAGGSDDAPSPSADAGAWPDFPADAQDGLPADAPAGFQSDALAGFQSDIPADFEADAPSLPDFPADAPAQLPAGYQPDNPADSRPDVPAWPDFPADSRPRGWDPIRVSSAWPAIPASAIDMAPFADDGAAAPPWEAAPWAGAGATPDAAAAASGGWAQAPGSSKAAAHAPGVVARSPGGAANRASVSGAGFASSRTWIVAVAVVLLCVLAVVLAIFA